MEKQLTARKRQALEMRSRIQNVALDLFDRDGFENVSVEQIAQAAGCSVGNIYHYFKSKDELIIHVTSSVDAYVKGDLSIAQKVIEDDDTVDGYFDQVKSRLIDRIAANPAEGEYALDLLMIAKYFERIADHAVNIAQWVIFSVTGEHKEG